jgi:GNAT superfamily N-acetyltransferase
MELRPARIEDASAISGLILSFSRDFTIAPDGTGAEQFLASVSAESEARYIADARYQYIAAVEGDKLLGFIAIRDRCHVFHLFVAQELQRRGLATQLWNAAKSSALETGNVTGVTVNSSRIAVAVYERFGFLATGPHVEKHGISFVPMQLPTTHAGCLE